jgi:hypothetical protein
MTTSRRRTLLAVLLVGFAACFGCNPAMLPMFLQGEAQEEPALKRLAKKDDKKEVKVAIVVSSRLSARQELAGVNRELGRKAVEQLRILAKANEDKLVVIEPSKVERYLASHPKWKEMDREELADDLKTALKVDYVIDVEINALSLIEGTDLYRGHADLHVSLWNTNDPDDGPHDKDIRSVYPKSAGELADSDTNLFDFRDKFLVTLAKQIAYCFCTHPTINQMDDSRNHLAD